MRAQSPLWPRCFARALVVPSVLVLAALAVPARAQEDNPMRVRIYAPAPTVRAVRPAAPTYRARRRYEAPRARLPAPVMIPVPELLPDGTANPAYAPGAMMPAPQPEAGTASPPAQPATPTVPAAQRPLIALLGDSMAEALGYGLEADAAFKGEFALRQKTVSASGLVRDDFHNWPQQVAALLKEAPAPVALVMMVGLNDRQILRQGGENLAPLSDPWREAYRKRVDAVINAAKAAKVPLVWVGLPAMRSQPLSGDITQINELIRERVNASGETFVEIYDGFADATGGFTATGPDIIGDTVRLRGPDGIHFTPAGQRKLAFFVDKPLRKRLEGTLRPAPLPQPNPASAPTSEVSVPLPAVRVPTPALPQIPARVRPERGEIRVLNSPPLASSLLGAAPPPHQDPEADALFRNGVAPAPRAGRADDYRWK